MTVVDAHTHVWGPDTDDYPWQAEVLPPEWEGPYTHTDLISDMDAAGIEEAVIVTTPLYGRGTEANDYTQAAIEAYPNRFYGVGLMDFFPEDPAEAAASLRRLVSLDRMVGVRIHAALEYAESPTTLDRHGDWFLDDRLNPVFEAAATEDVAIFVFPKAQQLTDVATVIRENPGVQFVIDHMAWPDETTNPHKRPWTAFKELAEYTNVSVKVSSLPRSSKEDWPYRDLWDYVRNLVDWYGAERLMLGSDYPWMDSWATYEECLSWVDEAGFLSDRDRRYLRGKTFTSIHR
ncbi:amidohydrolase family protein [Haloprofundus halobius]|uniref:amidohydrolase family protein n=1 Tax=Haloprofundus halobius TaxID=2876194 RepID=UPI001CCD6B7F|nr:amidohydrolase family protein [Haloprofundus halobius]